MKKPDYPILFRFKNDEGLATSLRIAAILGFSESWIDKHPLPDFKSAVIVATDRGTTHFASSEPIAHLESRYEDLAWKQHLAARKAEARKEVDR